MTSRLREKYREEVVPALMEEFGYENIMEVPKLEKIVINIGAGEAKENPRVIESVVEDLRAITGQQPVETKAKRSVANFKIREGMTIGAKVTLRGDKMYDFFDRLVNIALPRVRDFRGVRRTSFDGRGNYALGLKEQLIFPEIDFDDIDTLRGMDISIITSAETDEEALKFLQAMGMPFARRRRRRRKAR